MFMPMIFLPARLPWGAMTNATSARSHSKAHKGLTAVTSPGQ
jgi:hypothetical protein